MARLEDFSRSTRPLVNDLKGPADDLGPTVRDLGDLAPDLEKLFRDLGPLIRAGRTGVPALERTLEEAEPLTEALHTFFPELNPILSYFNFHQTTIAAFITNGGADLAADYGTGQRGQTQVGIVSENRNFESYPYGEEPPDWARGNAYLHPNALMRALVLGGIESYKCPAGERKYAEDALEPGQDHDDKRAPCLEVPPSLYDGKLFAIPRRGVAPLRDEPQARRGQPAGAGPRPERLDARHTSAVCRSSSSARTGGWEGRTSSSTSSSSTSRRSSSAWRRSGCSRSTRTPPAASSG